MTISEAQQFFLGSEFSDETKTKIMGLLSDKDVLDPFTIIEIKAAMHEELANDIHEEGIDVSSEPEVQALDAEYAVELENIQTEMKEDSAYVESELQALDKVRKEVMRVSDHLEAEDIKKSI